MKAMVYRRYGPPNVLHMATVEKPTPKANEIRIRVHACEATKADCELRAFNFPVKWFSWPLRLALGITKPRKQILGGYLAGTVDAVGSKVTKFEVGDEVFGSSGFKFGGYGEYVCVSEKSTLAWLPEGTTFAEAAAVPLGGLNAIHFMHLADVQPDESVLIIGAGGSIGCYAVQIAKFHGATVTALDADYKKDFCTAMGADHFIDYRQQSLADITERYDVILNMVAQTDFYEATALLTETGRYLMGNPKVRDMLQTRKFNKRGTQQAFFNFAEEGVKDLFTLKNMIEHKHLKPAVDEILPLREAQTAHARVEEEDRCGALVLAHEVEYEEPSS